MSRRMLCWEALTIKESYLKECVLKEGCFKYFPVMICFCKISNRTFSKPFEIITWDFEDTLPLFSGTWLFVPFCRPPHYWSVSGGIASNKCTGPCENNVTADQLVAGTPWTSLVLNMAHTSSSRLCVVCDLCFTKCIDTIYASLDIVHHSNTRRERELSDKPQQEPLHGIGPYRIRSPISGWINNCWTSQTDISANVVSNANDIGWNVSNFQQAQITAVLTYKFEASTKPLPIIVLVE